jgi:acyl-CoA thioesterase-1
MNSGIRLRRWCLALLLALSAAAFAQTGTRPVLLVLGDSLSAEYGLPRDSGWVKLLADRLATLGPEGAPQYNVVNASISGETTSGGRTRLPGLLTQHRPAIVIIELGGNDGLRGLPLSVMRENLGTMVEASQRSGARVLVVGLRIPPNYGRAYTDGFFDTFADVVRERKAALAPFLLEGFADQPELFQGDRIHPTVKAQPKMLDNVWPYLQPLLAARGKH